MSRPAELVLASTSVYRRELLKRLGVTFRCVAPRLDEASLDAQGREPAEIATLLALGKASSIAPIEPSATIIGSDQIVAIEGRTLGKPGSRDRAIAQLLELSGRTHELITAVAVLKAKEPFQEVPSSWLHTDITRMTMRALSRDEIERYVDHENPFDCAGSYKFEARGVVLFEKVETDDPSAITGLPLMALVSFLRSIGHAVP
ncbi:MAG: septum formation protein Maf [Planctomycetaceae bacterium]|nr:septum formation protein Maf [Planctomycetaceae bacterium]